MGITIPITSEETTKTQSRLLKRNTVWNINAIINIMITTIIWAVSIPSANSNKGRNPPPLSSAVKKEAKPNPWMSPKKMVIM